MPSATLWLHLALKQVSMGHWPLLLALMGGFKRSRPGDAQHSSTLFGAHSRLSDKLFLVRDEQAGVEAASHNDGAQGLYIFTRCVQGALL